MVHRRFDDLDSHVGNVGHLDAPKVELVVDPFEATPHRHLVPVDLFRDLVVGRWEALAAQHRFCVRVEDRPKLAGQLQAVLNGRKVTRRTAACDRIAEVDDVEVPGSGSADADGEDLAARPPNLPIAQRSRRGIIWHHDHRTAHRDVAVGRGHGGAAIAVGYLYDDPAVRYDDPTAAPGDLAVLHRGMGEANVAVGSAPEREDRIVVDEQVGSLAVGI